MGGTLCFSGDLLTPTRAAIAMSSPIHRGSTFVLNNVGAYSFVGAGNFHNIPRLPILLVEDDLTLTELAPQGESWPD